MATSPSIPYAETRARGFSDATRRDVRAFSEAFFSADGGAPDADRMEWFLDDLGDFIGRMPPRTQGMFQLLVVVPTYVAPLMVRHVGRLADLPIPERIEALEKLERSPLGMPLFAMKAMTSLVYYEHPDAAREINWDQRCGGRR